MSAERLREAARVLRFSAELVSFPQPGYDGTEGAYFIPGFAERMSPQSYTYMQNVNPDVGLALADWLDVEAGRNPERATLIDGVTIGGPLLQALAVADAILGGRS